MAELLEKSRQLSTTDTKKADSLARLMFETTENATWKGRASLVTATIARRSNLIRCFAWADSSVRYAKMAKDWATAGTAARLQGVSAGQLFKHEQALKLLLLAKNYLEEAKDTSVLIVTLINLSLLYHNDIKDYDRGKFYGLEALSIAEKSGVKNQLWFINNAIAINYDDNNEPAMALKFHRQNLAISSDSALLAETHNNIANTLLKTGNINEGLTYLNNAYALYKRYSPPADINYDFATVFNNLSCAYALSGNIRLMKAYRDSAIYFATKSNNIEKLYDCYRDAYQNEQRLGNYQKANQFLTRYLSLKDSVYTTEKALAISDFEVQYETQKKENEITMLKVASVIKDLEVRQARNSIIILLFLIAVVVLIVVVVFRRNVQRNKIKSLQDQEEFRRRQFAAVLEGEERERARVARELHDGVGQLLSITKLSLTGVRDDLNERNPLLDNAIVSLDDATKEVRSVSHNLMPASLSAAGLEAALRDLGEKINRSEKVRVTVELTGLDEIKDQTTEIHIYRMLQELTHNILKYAEAQKIHIRVVKNHDHIEILLRDNGKKLEAKAFETSDGLGWKNVMARIAVLNGRIDVDSSDQHGTKLEIILPV